MDRAAIDSWFGQVEDILDRCLSEPIASEAMLRAVFEMVMTGPSDICDPIRPAVSRAAFQRLLDAEAFESAALRLLVKCGYMLSRSGEGLIIATVVLPSSERDYSFDAPSEAVALCGALASCIHASVIAG